MIWPAVAFTVPLGVLIVLKGPQVGAALAASPPMALIAAVGAHVGSLICRCEAWRLAVHATDCTPIPRTSTHAAGGVGFAAGSLQGASTAPVRAVALRKIARRFAPPIEHSLVAEAPIFFIDAGLTALVLAFAVATAAAAPAWAPALAGAVSIASIAGLWVAGRRYGHKRAGAGLRVLSDARRRLPLTALVAGTVVFGLLRAWIMLSAFGLPDEPASVASITTWGRIARRVSFTGPAPSGSRYPFEATRRSERSSWRPAVWRSRRAGTITWCSNAPVASANLAFSSR
jgi:hypothetical protein